MQSHGLRRPGSVADAHTMRRPEMPPHPPDVAPIATRHDDGMKQTMDNLLRLPGENHEQDVARNIVSLPVRMGGLGIRSAQRTAPGAYCASWTDALHMIDQRLPTVADRVVNTLMADEDPGRLFGGVAQRSGVA